VDLRHASTRVHAFLIINTPSLAAFFYQPHSVTSRTMSGFDLDRVFSVSVHDDRATNLDAPSETARLLNEFLLQFRVGGEYIYRSVPQ
jgi:hypothetical protein